MLPALAPLAKLGQIALCRAQVVEKVAPGRAAGPVGAVEQAAGLLSSAQARGGRSRTLGELGKAAGCGVATTSVQDRQGVGPSSPARCKRGARSALQTKAAQARGQHCKAACGGDLGVTMCCATREDLHSQSARGRQLLWSLSFRRYDLCFSTYCQFSVVHNLCLLGFGSD